MQLQRLTLFLLTLMMLFAGEASAACPVAHQPKWYVQKGANGAGNGSSWTNAWGESNLIDWSCIKAGDTIYIGGGTYSGGLVIGKSGTAALPISILTGIRATDGAGHDGRVIFLNTGISSTNNAWVTIDGRKNPALTYPQVSTLAD